MSDCTVAMQNGKIYAAVSHSLPPKYLTQEMARLYKDLWRVPGCEIRVLPVEQVRQMEWASPT